MKAGCGGMIVTVADALSVESSLWTAVTLTVDGFGAIAGAVYRPSAVTVPPVESPPGRSFTPHPALVGGGPRPRGREIWEPVSKTRAPLGGAGGAPHTPDTH